MSNRDLCNHHGRAAAAATTYNRLRFLRSAIVLYKGASTRLSLANLNRYVTEYEALKAKAYRATSKSWSEDDRALSEAEIEADFDLERHIDRGFYGMAW